MDREFIFRWDRDKKVAAAAGKKLSWSKWLAEQQRRCHHTMNAMYGPMDNFSGARCTRCDFTEWRF